MKNPVSEWTEEQRPVVDHREGAAIVISGAGSGKTSTIVGRALGMIQDGIPPLAHLMLTFSNKAGGEMRSRLVQMAPGDERVRRMRVGTFHSFGFRFIREYPSLVGRQTNVTIADDTDQKRYWRRAAEDAGFDLKDGVEKQTIKKVAKLYSLIKNFGRAADRDAEWINGFFRQRTNWQDFTLAKAMRLIEAYDRHLKQSNSCDFDDLCLFPSRGLRARPDIAERLSRQFQYITCDECQDTNLVQYDIVRSIARYHSNVLCVGDQKQAIFAFRGARPENLQQFIDDFKPKEYSLQRNFRSTAPIVNAAANLIANNTKQLPGRAFSLREEGRPPYLVQSNDGNEMTARIAESISKLVQEGAPLTDIAVLYRTNRISRLVEIGMRSVGVRYKIVGGMSLYETKEVRAAMAAGRLIQNPRDLEALTALAEFIPGLSTGSIEKMAANVGGPNDLDVWQAATAVGGRAAAICSELLAKLQTLEEMGPDHAGLWMSGERGLDIQTLYRNKAAKSSTPDAVEKEGERRLANLVILDQATTAALKRVSLASAPEDEELPEEFWRIIDPAEQWNIFLESRLDDREKGDEEENKKDVVTLSTIHRAKGLEWRYVFVAGFSDGLLPIRSQNDLDEDDGDDDARAGGVGGIEEERRLAYVAVTRAKDVCELHHAMDLSPFNNNLLSVSPFWKEMKVPETELPSACHEEEVLDFLPEDTL